MKSLYLTQLELLDLQLEQQLLLLADKLNISKLVLCQKHVLENGSQNRCSYMVYKQQVYKSKIKNHTPKEHIGGGDSFVGSLINSLLRNKIDNESKNIVTSILDTADYYTIEPGRPFKIVFDSLFISEEDIFSNLFWDSCICSWVYVLSLEVPR